MVLFDSAATSKKGDEECDKTNHYQKYRCIEKGITQKVQVVAIHSLDHATSDNQCQPRNLQKINEHTITTYVLDISSRVAPLLSDLRGHLTTYSSKHL